MVTKRGTAIVRKELRAALVGLFGLAAAGIGCDALLTEAPSDADLMDAPFEGLSDELARMFARGDENFEHSFSVSEGLGPIFNNTACAGCHSGDGRGRASEALIRFSVGTDLAFDKGGPQLQDRAIPGVPPEVLPPGVDVSRRLPPPVFGVGLIEAIPEASILANQDANDIDQDGISGRPNWVNAADFVPLTEVGGGFGVQLGRFGRKANVSSLLEQVVTAYHQDMGITSDFLPQENPHPQAAGVSAGDDVADPEIAANTIMETLVYVRLLKPPGRGAITASVKRGEQVFMTIGCASCHVPSFTTGTHPVPQLSEVDVPLYSDLLLHDMGEELADRRPDGSADGFEWRTAPLWGTRLVEDFLDGQAFFLHDGRARSLSEAIMLHGGEAQAARDAFAALPSADAEALIDFLKSL